MYSDGARSLLPKDIHDLGNFDRLGLAYFMRHDKYGLIDSNGQILLEERYLKAEQLQGGYYQCLKKDGLDLVKFEDGEFSFRYCLELNKVEKGWYTVKFLPNRVLINTEHQVEIPLDRNDKIIDGFNGYVYAKIQDTLRLFGPDGKQIEMGNNSPIFSEGAIVIEGVENQLVVFPDRVLDLPKGSTNISLAGSELNYSLDKQTRIIDISTGELILEVTCDKLRRVANGYMEITLDGKVGIISDKGKIICPTIYESASVVGNFLMVRTKSGLGVLDLAGKQLVPCKYNRLRPSRDYFLAISGFGLYGLYSRKSNREILDCVYDRIMFGDSKVRAWSNNKIRILELDDQHKITSDLVLDNVITLDHDGVGSSYKIDDRLYSLGWYIENLVIYDSAGFKVKDIQKWGLHGANDTVLMEPRYKQPTFVPRADFSLVPGPQKTIVYDGKKGGSRTTLMITSHITGKNLINEAIISVDTSDLMTRNYTRFLGTEGPGFILDDNRVVRAHFIDGYDTKYVRYCAGEERKIFASNESDPEALKYPNMDLNDNPALSIDYFLEDSYQEFFRYENVEWNFLDTSGNHVFENHLEFAFPYRRNTAIIKTEGKWGVALEDSIVIAPIYSYVSRASELSDTIFLVKRTPGGVRYIDSAANTMKNGITRFTLSKGSLSQIQINNKKAIITPEYEIISGETSFQKLFDNNLFYSKRKKEFSIFSQSGAVIGNTKLKPEKFIGEEYIVTSSKGKKGVVSMDDEILIPFIYKNIEMRGNYIFAVNGFENMLYDGNLKLLMKCKSNKVLVDTITGNYALSNGLRISTYDINTGKKTGSWKGWKFSDYHNGWIVEAAKESRLIHSSGRIVQLSFQIAEVISMGESGYLVHGTNKSSHYFDTDWKEKRFKAPLKKAKYVGEGRAVSRTKLGLVLFGGETEQWYEMGRSVKGDFSNGYLLLYLKGKSFYVNPEGKNVFQREFIDATPFGTKYATVKERAGWTLMDANGYFKALPSFNKIKELGSNVFSTSKQSVYGLFDSHGNVILPVKFQKINILNKNLIQGIVDGEIHYFNQKGEEIILD
ncbi:MAG: hypothetical protein ACI837_001353 [Crocinitomicaceae bacterium]|jgi:hypothetical protein